MNRMPTAKVKRNNVLLRRLHAWVGILASLNLLLLIITGLLIQHRDLFRLENTYVSRRFLPSGYRSNDGPEVRSDIVVTDLHSGRILGPSGTAILDVITVGWFVLLATGAVMFALRGNNRGGKQLRDEAERDTFE